MTLRIILFFIFIININAETIDKMELEKKLNYILNLESLQRKEHLEQLSQNEIETLLSYVKYKYIQKDKNLESIFQIYEILSEQKAIVLSHKRLNNLLWVIGITLLLFSSYTSYIFIQQNKILKQIEKQSK